MTHAQWNSKVKRALRLADREPKDALQTLRTLARKLEAQLPNGIHDWHLAQTLQVMSVVQSKVGDYRASANTLLRVAEQHEHELLYQTRGFVSACAAAAVQLAQAGDRSGAARVLRKAAPWAASLRPKDRLLAHAQKAVRALSRHARKRKAAG